jgi:hypothetical protein
MPLLLQCHIPYPTNAHVVSAFFRTVFDTTATSGDSL